MLTITRERFVEALDKLIAETPADYRYEVRGFPATFDSCRYALTDDGPNMFGEHRDQAGTVVKGSCIIGKLIEILDPPTLQAIVDGGHNRDSTVGLLLGRYIDAPDVDVRVALHNLQRKSDGGVQWLPSIESERRFIGRGVAAA